MNKTELIDFVAKTADLKKKDAEAAVAAVLQGITDALAAGDKVQLIGFGTFAVKAVAAKEARNPRTGEKIAVPASKKPVFSASKTLKDATNG